MSMEYDPRMTSQLLGRDTERWAPLRVGPFEIEDGTVRAGGQHVAVTVREFQVLHSLARRARVRRRDRRQARNSARRPPA